MTRPASIELHDQRILSFLEESPQSIAFHSGDRLEDANVEFAADHRCGAENTPAAVAQTGEPPTDDLADALREPDLVRRDSARPPFAFPPDDPFLGEVPQRLFDEERISFGLAVDRTDEGF